MKRRQGVKKVIEILEDGLAYIRGGETADYESDTPTVLACLNAAETQIKKAIAELKTPRRYTPEQWLERTGVPWPDNGAVYMLYKPPEVSGVFPFWRIETYCYAKMYLNGVAVHSKSCFAVVCATEAGPPPDGWRPEK
jgi:hypothetical protein